MHCDNCSHRCCVNGESGTFVYGECEICEKEMYLCTNEYEDKFDEKCNGDACGCADTTDPWICDSCSKD